MMRVGKWRKYEDGNEGRPSSGRFDVFEEDGEQDKGVIPPRVVEAVQLRNVPLHP